MKIQLCGISSAIFFVIATSSYAQTTRETTSGGAAWDSALDSELTPTNAGTYYNRGLAKAKTDLDGAIADYNRAIALDPKIADAYGQVLAQENSGPVEFNVPANPKYGPKHCTPDGRYCVQMVYQRLPDAPNGEDSSLVVSSKDKVLSRFPTYGSFRGIYWSPNRKYVALNNRRANGGDYLWIISLTDGKALKIPDDLAIQLGKEELGHAKGDNWKQDMEEVYSRFPQCVFQSEHPEFVGVKRDYLVAQRWKSSTELAVFHEVRCYRDAETIIEIKKVYRIDRGKAALIAQAIETQLDSLYERLPNLP